LLAVAVVTLTVVLAAVAQVGIVALLPENLPVAVAQPNQK
jgi:hypothetical protein